MEDKKLQNVLEEWQKLQPLTQSFIRTLHRTLLREDYTVYRNLPGGVQTSYTVHARQYKTRPNSVITRYGDRVEFRTPTYGKILHALLCHTGISARGDRHQPFGLAENARHIAEQGLHRP